MAEKNPKKSRPLNEGVTKGNTREVTSSGRQAPPPPKPTPKPESKK